MSTGTARSIHIYHSLWSYPQQLKLIKTCQKAFLILLRDKFSPFHIATRRHKEYVRKCKQIVNEIHIPKRNLLSSKHFTLKNVSSVRDMWERERQTHKSSFSAREKKVFFYIQAENFTYKHIRITRNICFENISLNNTHSYNFMSLLHITWESMNADEATMETR